MKFLNAQQSDSNTKFLAIRSSTWFIVITIIPVFPYSLKTRFGVPNDEVQYWNSALLTSFGAAQFFFSPIIGHFADRNLSRRSPLLLGFLGNAAATALLYLASNVWMLVLSRFLQGLSAAVVYTVGFALVADTVGQESIGQWMGFVISSLNVGMMVSPALGGILYDAFGYESIFVATFVLIGIDICLRIVMVEKKHALKLKQPLVVAPEPHYGTLLSPEGKHLANDHSISSTFSTSNEVEAPSLVQASSGPSDLSPVPSAKDTLPPAPMSSSPARTDVHPLRTLLCSPRILTSLYGALVTVVVLVAFDAALPIFVAQHFGWSSTGGGLIFLAITLPIFSAPIAGFTRTFGSSPLGADLTRAVADMVSDDPSVFGGKDPTAQVFSLYTSSSAAGVLIGPLVADIAFGHHNWVMLVVSLGLLSASVAVPILLFKPKSGKNKGKGVIAV
ncbi:Chitin synthase D [Venturia nashicola]|uniref:Chitin synthase D n=1 Tax=Venturia nashicola TaxID=86259 RepID=A0A4Z1NJK9_9PEZI|nr:Chitin synthase D [Venturia nashicola]